MAKIVHAPVLLNKTYIVSTPSGTSGNWTSMRFHKVNTFPRKSGFHSEGDAKYMDLYTAVTLCENPSLAEILDITASTKHLGVAYLDYILENIRVFNTIYKDSWLVNNKPTKELKYTLVLTQLISLNLIRRIKGEPYNLPAILSRKFIDINTALEAYYKNEPKSNIYYMNTGKEY